MSLLVAPEKDLARSRAGRRSGGIAFLGLFAAGLVVRIAYVLSAAHQLDSDHAVVYLMAKHALEGEFSPFFWGQSYGGSLLSLSVAGVMAVVGTAPVVMPVVSVLWMAGAALLLRMIVARSVGSVAGNVAGILFWFPGLDILVGSTRDPGFYSTSLVIGLGVVAIAVSARRPQHILRWIGAGLLCGLALWTSPMALAFAAPGAVGLLLRGGLRPLNWLTAAVAAAIGASPWLVAAASAPVTRPAGAATGIHWESFATVFTKLLPAAFTPAAGPLISQVIAALAVLAILAMGLVGAIRRRGGVVMLAVATVLVVGVLVYGSGVELQADSRRYAVFLAPALAAALGWAVSWFRPAAWVAMLAAPAITVALVVQATGGFQWQSSRFDPRLTEVGTALQERGLEHVYASYWISYALSAATEEDVTAAALVNRRYTAYETAAAEADPLAFVVNADQANDVLLAGLAEQYGGSRSELDGYAIWTFTTPFDVYAQGWQIV
ncbi:hypothetical protein [Rathayibacter sp. Leaf296]|uniref:hypothetical protein n=1 Tax=Rathayibacter sp. Leaf296 TaxID=1736327 RepID=UPI000702DC73|nr:hypothetical protein [Rathayibacter sp. Leaf296]KQQ10512.1 hypothetical protein ASF46_05580 [Rathayibacter sp. Leaf296]